MLRLTPYPGVTHSPVLIFCRHVYHRAAHPRLPDLFQTYPLSRSLAGMSRYVFPYLPSYFVFRPGFPPPLAVPCSVVTPLHCIAHAPLHSYAIDSIPLCTYLLRLRAPTCPFLRTDVFILSRYDSIFPSSILDRL